MCCALIRQLEYGLSTCAETRIGNELVNGISGGECKRVSSGSKLATRSPLPLLAEPTSGLEYFNSVSIVSSRRKLTSNGNAIVCIISQFPFLRLYYKLQ
jgi:ABC-type multidrug transport system ATPase subunit